MIGSISRMVHFPLLHMNVLTKDWVNDYILCYLKIILSQF